jgi:hypothetical protein
MTSEIQQLAEYKKKLVYAYRAVYAFGVLNLFLSILAFTVASGIPDAMTIGILFLLIGLLYLVLGYFVQRKSKIALSIAVGFMVLNLIAGIVQIIQTGKPAGLGIAIVFLSQTWGGFKAIEMLKQKN